MEWHNQPVEIFTYQLTFLTFDDVISVAQTNSKIHSYCMNSRYGTLWKKLTDNIFGYIFNYHEKLQEVWSNMNVSNTYNYLVYTNFIKFLDPTSQLVIYHSRNNKTAFNSNRFTNIHRAFAYFFLGDVEAMCRIDKKWYNLLTSYDRHRIIRSIELLVATESILGLTTFLSRDNILGTCYLYPHFHKNRKFSLAVGYAIQKGKLEIVKYLVHLGFDIHCSDSNNVKDLPLRLACQSGQVEIVKYLVDRGADIHVLNDLPLQLACRKGHSDVVKYLVEAGSDIHARNSKALRLSLKYEHQDVLDFLTSL